MNNGLGLKAVIVAMLLAGVTVAYGQGVTAEVTPAAQMLGSATHGLTVDHWKTSKAMKDATLGNLASIQKDVDGTLPALTTAANEGTVTSLLPLYRNLGALYDVVLRVVVVADASAPGDQASGLEQALMSVDVARKKINERLQSAADAQEKQVSDLKKKVSLAAAAPAPVAVAVPPPCKPAVKKKVVKKAPASAQ